MYGKLGPSVGLGRVASVFWLLLAVMLLLVLLLLLLLFLLLLLRGEGKLGKSVVEILY